MLHDMLSPWNLFVFLKKSRWCRFCEDQYKAHGQPAPIGTGYDSQDTNGIVQAMGSNPTEKKKVWRRMTPTRIRFPHDRRKGKDRRNHRDHDYFLKGGIERRSGWERRTQGERRWNWIRVDKWSSARLPYSEYTTFLRPRFSRKRSD